MGARVLSPAQAAKNCSCAGVTMSPPRYLSFPLSDQDRAGLDRLQRHLRDAYYAVVLSYAIDDVMDALGLDARIVNVHVHAVHPGAAMHYLHGGQSTDETRRRDIDLDADRKTAFMWMPICLLTIEGAVATGELMLLHVHQAKDQQARHFRATSSGKLRRSSCRATRALVGPGSRKIELKSAEPHAPIFEDSLHAQHRADRVQRVDRRLASQCRAGYRAPYAGAPD